MASIPHSHPWTSGKKKTKLNGEALVLSKIINSMHLIDIYGSFHWNSENSASQRTSSKIHHILGYKENLSKYRKIEIASSILSDHSRIKMAINNRNSENIQTHRNQTTHYWINLGQERHHTGNQRILGTEWKWKPNIPEFNCVQW